jgi:hypothetical protein
MRLGQQRSASRLRWLPRLPRPSPRFVAPCSCGDRIAAAPATPISPPSERKNAKVAVPSMCGWQGIPHRDGHVRHDEAKAESDGKHGGFDNGERVGHDDGPEQRREGADGQGEAGGTKSPMMIWADGISPPAPSPGTG